jgi:PhzF family phenazine biosynthesis protein
MKLKMYQVDAFAEKIFTGNPAGVCPLPGDWLEDSLMQNIAFENNLAETAFYIKHDNKYSIRWFTPALEVDLCGHATLATGHVLFTHENYSGSEIQFQSKSGPLSVKKDNDYLTLNFPTDVIQKIDISSLLTDCFDIKPVEAYKGNADYLLVFESEDQIRNIKFNLTKILLLKNRGVIITARGKEVDFVSRFFAPFAGIDEDPVTGSAHTTLTPYWSGVLHKNELTAMQVSKRSGFLICKNLGARTEISGKAKTYLQGEISV